MSRRDPTPGDFTGTSGENTGTPGTLGENTGTLGGTTGTPGENTDTPGEPGRRYPFRPALVLAVLASLGLLATAGVKSYRDLGAARDHEQKLRREITSADQRIRALHGRIDGIQNDPVVLERLAREDLGLVREGDVVIVLPEPPPESPEPPRPTSDTSLP